MLSERSPIFGIEARNPVARVILLRIDTIHGPLVVRLILYERIETIESKRATAAAAAPGRGCLRLVFLALTADLLALLPLRPPRRTALLPVRPLGAAADDLDLVGRHALGAVLHLEGDLLDEKSPDFVAEAVGVEGALEGQAGLDLIAQRIRHDPVEVVQDLHRQLRVEFRILDKLIESLDQRYTEAAGDKC